MFADDDDFGMIGFGGGFGSGFGSGFGGFSSDFGGGFNDFGGMGGGFQSFSSSSFSGGPGSTSVKTQTFIQNG